MCKRRIAVNKLITQDGTISPAMVEIEGTKVNCYGRLSREIAFTEWLGGSAVITSFGGEEHLLLD